MPHALLEENLDDLIKAHIEPNFPVEVIADKENRRGLFKFTSAFPPFEGTVVQFGQAYYDDFQNSLQFSFLIVENPKSIAHENNDLRNILFKIISYIYQLECQVLLQKNKSPQ